MMVDTVISAGLEGSESSPERSFEPIQLNACAVQALVSPVAARKSTVDGSCDESQLSVSWSIVVMTVWKTWSGERFAGERVARDVSSA